MEPVKFDHKPEGLGPGPVKIKGLNLESEKKEKVEQIVDAASEGLTVPDPIPEVDRALTIQESLILILTRVEALDKTDNTTKAIGKLKGAIELLKD